MFFTDKAFWMATAERAVKSFGQGMVAALGADQLIDALQLDYLALMGAGLGMAFLSVVTSLGSATIGERGVPSLAGETLTGKVAAVEVADPRVEYEAGPAADVPEGTPVDVVPDVLERGHGDEDYL